MTETLSREPSEWGGFEGVANGAEVNQVGDRAAAGLEQRMHMLRCAGALQPLPCTWASAWHGCCSLACSLAARCSARTDPGPTSGPRRPFWSTSWC